MLALLIALVAFLCATSLWALAAWALLRRVLRFAGSNAEAAKALHVLLFLLIKVPETPLEECIDVEFPTPDRRPPG